MRGSGRERPVSNTPISVFVPPTSAESNMRE
jgi:hypothetical protein